jgi:hypothetical protein
MSRASSWLRRSRLKRPLSTPSTQSPAFPWAVLYSSRCRWALPS